MVDLKDKLVVVTGGARGIGAAIAEGCRGAGARVVCVDLRFCGDLHPDIESRELDITDAEAVDGFADDLRTRYGVVHGLVNNAGIARPNSLMDLDRQAWREVQEVDLLAPVAMVHALLRSFDDQASVVNVTSIRARRGFAGDLAYIAAKGGLEAATRAMAIELAPRGVRVNALAPGAIATEFNREALLVPEHRAEALARIPLGIFGRPADLAGAATFLLSPASSFITGATIVVDGGQTIRG